MTEHYSLVERINTISDIAIRQSGEKADQLLMDIADQGDENALEVLRELPPHVKARIVREHDFTKPSFLGLLSSPKDIVDAIAADPSTWCRPESMSETEAQTILDDVTCFIISILLSKDDEVWLAEVFEAIGESDEALLYLAIPFIGHTKFNRDEDNFGFTFSEAERCDGEIGHLHQVMKDCAPDIEQRVGSIVHMADDYQYNNTIVLLSEIHELVNKNSGIDTSIADDMLEDL